jgi:predicted MFS family arabinose efflux permease
MEAAATSLARPSADRPGGASPLRLLLIATFVLNASTSVVFALISDLQDAHGLSTASLGLIAGTGFVVGLTVQLLVAPLADRGRAKRLLLGGLALAVVGSTAFAFGSTLLALLGSRALVGAAAGCFIPAARAIAAGSRPDGAGESLGRLAQADLAGFATGPIIGGLLVGPLGLRSTFLFFALVAAVALVLLAPRTMPTLPTTAESSRPSLELLRYRGVVVATLLALALFLPVGVFDSLWDRYLTDLGGGNLLVGLTFLMYGLPFVALAAAGGRLAERVGHVRISLYGLAMLVPMTAVYGVIRSPLVLAIIPMFEAVAQAATVPASQAAMAAACPPGRAAAGQGLAGAVQLAGAAAAALVAAPIYGRSGPMAVFGLAALVMGLLAIAAAALHHGSTPSRSSIAEVSSAAR